MKVSELIYGKNAVHFLYELSQHEKGEDFIGGEFEVYGENEQGIEGSATIDIIKLASDAHNLITELTQALQALNQSINYGTSMDVVQAHEVAQEVINKALGE